MIVEAPFAVIGRRLLLLADGCFSAADAKTAACIAMYRGDDVVAVLDASRAGRTVGKVLGFGGAAPVVGTLDEAFRLRPEVAILGTAPRGGVPTAHDRAVVARCLEAGLDVVSGMHEFLGDDAGLCALCAESGARIWDVRRVEESHVVSSGLGCTTGARVVSVVGSDCGVGKMTVTVELHRAAVARGVRAAWAATGQTGIILRGRGVPVDRVVSDFVGGETEALVDREGRDADVVFVEGQGGITHPGYAAVALGLLVGAMPDAMVFVHAPDRAAYKRFDLPIPPLSDLIDLHEALMKPFKPARVVAVALDTSRLSESDARRAADDTERSTGLPATDVIRFGVDRIWSAIDTAIHLQPGDPS
jgi:D-glutamate N-acetyltransferase